MIYKINVIEIDEETMEEQEVLTHVCGANPNEISKGDWAIVSQTLKKIKEGHLCDSCKYFCTRKLSKMQCSFYEKRWGSKR